VTGAVGGRRETGLPHLNVILAALFADLGAGWVWIYVSGCAKIIARSRITPPPAAE
jgi:hypothetical protein